MLECRAIELREELLGAIEQTGTMKILCQLVRGHRAPVSRQVRPVQQVLVHPDRPIDFALAPKQRTQREVQIDRLGIYLDHFDERFDGLVRLLVQQKIETAEVRQRQRP